MTVLAGVLPAYGTVAGEVSRAALLAGAFGLVFALAELWSRRFGAPVEWTRKFVHVAGGGLSMCLPWLFRYHWTVLALALSCAGSLWVARRLGGLKSIHAVERASRGELYFPLGVYLLFVLARHQPVFYVISLFTLVVSDALAALLGKAYGRHPYTVGSDRRSIEGSAVFLLATFLGVHLPLLLMTPIDRGTTVIIAAQLALIVASFEAISTGGMDNLVLPLASYYLLLKLTPRPAESTALQLAVQLGILALTLVLARRTRFLTFSGALAAHLVLYAAFSLGGPGWIVAPALALATFMVLDTAISRALSMPRGGYQVVAIFYVSIVSVLLIFADNSFATLLPRRGPLASGHPFHTPFVGSLAAPVAILAFEIMESMPRVRRRPILQRALAAAALGFAAVAPLGLWALAGRVTAEGLASAALIDAGSLSLFLASRRLIRRRRGTIWDLRLVGLCVLAATLAVLPLHLAWRGASE